MHYPPNNYKEIVRLLIKLGFNQVHSGKHSFKFKHSQRKPKDYTQRDFIVVSTGKGITYSRIIIRELMKVYGYTEEEIKSVC